MEKSKWETLNASWLFIRYVNNTIKKVLIIKIRNFLATQKAKKKNDSIVYKFFSCLFSLSIQFIVQSAIQSFNLRIEFIHDSDNNN